MLLQGEKIRSKRRQLYLWTADIIDRILFQINIEPQARGGGGGGAALVGAADCDDVILLRRFGRLIHSWLCLNVICEEKE